MGPFPIMNRLAELTVPVSDLERRSGDSLAAIQDALRGDGALGFSAYADRHPREALALLPNFEAKELEHTSFAGAPVYLAVNGRGETRIVPVRGEPRTAFEPADVMRVVREAVGGDLAELRLMEEYDAYYLDRRGERPLPVVYARLNDGVGTRYYIDPKTARVVGRHDARNWVSRWLYHGLHSLDFPWLYKHRPLWDIVVITLMLGGTALSVTSIVLTWRVLARKLVAVFRARFDIPNEDLAVDMER